MQKRPWPLTLLAWLQILTPAFSIALNCALQKISVSEYLLALWNTSPWDAFEVLFIMPIAGVAILCVRSWSYPVFVSAVLWTGVQNFREYQLNPQIPIGLVIGLYVLNLLLVAYFLIPAVWKTYYNPRVRWWQSKPRYYLDIPGQALVSDQTDAQVTVGNLSLGGAFVQTRAPLKSGDRVTLKFNVMGRPFEFNGEIVYARTQDSTTQAGLRFEPTRTQKLENRALVDAMDALELETRPERSQGLRGFMDQVRHSIATGKGWVPELPKNIETR